MKFVTDGLHVLINVTVFRRTIPIVFANVALLESTDSNCEKLPTGETETRNMIIANMKGERRGEKNNPTFPERSTYRIRPSNSLRERSRK